MLTVMLFSFYEVDKDYLVEGDRENEIGTVKRRTETYEQLFLLRQGGKVADEIVQKDRGLILKGFAKTRRIAIYG